MIEFTDTHCHIHEAQFELNGDEATRAVWQKAKSPNPDDMIARALKNGVSRMICVGTTLVDSQQAVDFVRRRPNCWASIGLHPHEAKEGQAALDGIANLMIDSPAGPVSSDAKSHVLKQPRVRGTARERFSVAADTRGFVDSRSQDLQAALVKKIVAIGEIGLDYFYNHSNKQEQQKALRFQIELALQHNLPIIFHVREAFNDFWPIFDSYKNIRGVLHSFTDNYANFEQAMARGLYIGINGIMTFTKSPEQLRIAKEVPLQKLLLETDAPFLTPAPLRGTVNEPANVRLVAEFLADLRAESLEHLATKTTHNANTLFSLS